MDNQSHISKLWWVLPNTLAGMAKPQEDDLSPLYNADIRAIVSLLEDQDGFENYKANGFESLWLPVADDGVPTSEQVSELVSFIDTQISQNNPVAIHCKGGKGRTGTLLAAYLISKGATYDEAMNQIDVAQPNAIRKDFQKVFLQELANR
mgnify:CR=1 FL=1